MKPRLNQNNTLLTILPKNSYGYKIYETFSYKKVTEDNDFQLIFGSLRFFIPLFESEICVFVGSNTNENFPPNQIVIWDDLRKTKLGIIFLKSTCNDIKIRREMIICNSDTYLYVFELMSLKLLFTIDDCNFLLPISINYIGNPCFIAYQGKTNPSQIKICKVKMEKISSSEIESFLNRKNIKLVNYSHIWRPSGKLHFKITTLFKNIFMYEVSPKGDFLVVIGNNNKIHIYSLLDFQLILCIDSENKDISIESIAFSPLNVFISIGFITGEVHIYSLISEQEEYFSLLMKKKKYSASCFCLEEFEKEMKSKESKSTSISMFSKIVNLKNVFFSQPKKQIFSSIIFQSQGRHYTSLFEKRNEITLISNCLVQKFKFSSSEGGRGWCFKSFEFTKEDLNEDLNVQRFSSSDGDEIGNDIV